MKELLKKQVEELARLNSKVIEKAEKELGNGAYDDATIELIKISNSIVSNINMVLCSGIIE